MIAARAAKRYGSFMRLRSARVPHIAGQMVDRLVKDGDIECVSTKEVQLDVEAVLNQYIRDEEAVAERARSLVQMRKLPSSELGRMRRLVADDMKVKIGDEAIDYLLDQLVAMLMNSSNVDEIFAEDVVLRRKMREPLRQQLAHDARLDQEIRGRLKHVQEGSQLWEIEYRRMMDEIKRRKGV